MWNSYKFFIDRAQASNWNCDTKRGELTVLDKWILARLTEVVLKVNDHLKKYDAAVCARAIEEFVVGDFSTWYIRRSRDRNSALPVMYGVLITLSKMLAPFMPFISDAMYRNLTGERSVHLEDYPLGDQSLLDSGLVKRMALVREIAELAHHKRKEAAVKLRQPLLSLTYKSAQRLADLEAILAEELNVKKIEYKKCANGKIEVELDTKITPKLAKEGEVRDLIRQIQQLRKVQNLTLADQTRIIAPNWPKGFEKQILSGTASVSITRGDQLRIEKV